MPLYSFHVPAGFPSPAADHIEKHISLDELFDIRAPHVYLLKIEDDSMQGAGIYCGDLVIVDRSLQCFTLGRLRSKNSKSWGANVMKTERNRCSCPPGFFIRFADVSA